MMRTHRIDGFTPLDLDDIAARTAAGERVIVQFNQRGYTDDQLDALNHLAKHYGSAFEIRFYGHEGQVFDGAVLRRLADAACVSVDCMAHARNLDSLAHLGNLQELSLGVFELDDVNVLAHCNAASLRLLSLSETRRRAINLAPLARCTALETLYLSGETKNMEVLCDLPRLHDLTLSSFRKKDDIAFVSHLAHLATLRMILGGRASIADLAAPLLEDLWVIRVRGLEDLGDLARFPRLRHVMVEDQIRLHQLRVAPNPALEEIEILHCKNFQRIDGLDALTALTSLRLYRTAVEYTALINGPLPATLAHVAYYTNSERRDDAIAADLLRRGFRLDESYARRFAP